MFNNLPLFDDDKTTSLKNLLQTTFSGTYSELVKIESEFSESKEISTPVIMVVNRESTLKQLTNLDMAY